MAPLPSYFGEFITNISLTSKQVDDLSKAHRTLRERLKNDKELSEIIKSTFLQGSYIRFTAVRPKSEMNPDVDVIVVTNLDKDLYTPQEALELFIDFLDKYYKGKYRIQGRSMGISMSEVDLDVVVTAAPSESEENIVKKMEALSVLSPGYLIRELDSPIVKSTYEEIVLNDYSTKSEDEILYIPDREANEWKPTNPREQIKWTDEKNRNTNGHYRKVVKALKWWKMYQYPDAKHPKSYPLEHFIGNCCPNGIESVAEGVARTLEQMGNIDSKPFLPDRGVEEHDVFGKITDEEYNEFHSQVSNAAVIAREALNSEDNTVSISKWKELFGNKFPESLKENKKGGYTGKGNQEDSGGRFA